MSTALTAPSLAPLLVLLAVVAGCASPLPQHPPPPDAPGRFEALTAPFVALGDTQEHESTGFPLLDNDGAVDTYVEVAQRPPEAPLFSRRILEWVVEHHRDDPVLHLGDVLDMSCRSELGRMLKLGLSTRQPGAVLPGNHDGLLFGIFNHDVADFLASDGARRWSMGCRNPVREGVAKLDEARGQALTKRDFILAYLGLLRTRLDAGADLPLPQGEGPKRVSWRNPDPAAFVSAVEVRLADSHFYAASFIVQRLRLPAAPGASRRVVMLGLDTNQIATIVSTLDAVRRTSPGDIGRADAEQVSVIEGWIEEARRDGDLVVFAGHHNWGQLTVRTRARLAEAMARLDHPLVYVSAHTHRGFWAMHALGDRPLLELNVSSLSDWPIAYRRLTFHQDRAANRLKVVGELLPREAAPPANDAELLRAWSARTCERAGVPVSTLTDEEDASVREQKAARGALWEWLVAHFGESCETCQRILFDHAHAYQDQLLRAIRQFESDVGVDTAGYAAVELPAACEGRGVADCAEHLRERHAPDLRGHIAGFREKARLVDRVNAHLDDLQEPSAKAYMACRAVLGAKSDFDATPEAETPGRSEAVRRAGDFFRLEATVGMRVAP